MRSHIEVKGERTEAHEDVRWGTQNTQLTAALLVLGFPFSPNQPFTITYKRVSGKMAETVTFWLFPVIRQDGIGTPLATPLSTVAVQKEWMEEKEGELPQIFWMRKGLEARKDCITLSKVPMSGLAIPAGYWATDDLCLASAVKSCGVEPYGFRDRKWYFPARAELFAAKCKAPIGVGTSRPLWAYLALQQQRLLMDTIRGPHRDNASFLQAFGPRGTAYIPVKLDANGQNAYLQQIHVP